MIYAIRRVRNEIVGEVLRRARGEEAAMRIFEFAQLRDHGGDDIGMRMAKARHSRPAGGVDVFLAVRVLHQDSLAADRNGVIVPDLSVKDVRHDRGAFGRDSLYQMPPAQDKNVFRTSDLFRHDDGSRWGDSTRQ